jgi:5-methyltetrahydropteroyltriglutamate--homocysteine methyltransferase
MNRILTTHAGSLPRPAALAALHAKKFRGEAIDASELDRMNRDAIAAVVRRQHTIGIDCINNREVCRESFFTYVQHRMTGFAGVGNRPPMRDLVKYRNYLDRMRRASFQDEHVSLGGPPAAVGAVRYKSPDAIEAECRDLAKALATVGRKPADAFVSVPSPGIVAAAMENRHYASLESYVHDVTTALSVEFRTVLAHGFQLQIDAPDLAMERHTYFADRPLADFLAFIECVGDELNRVLADAPRERIRLHVCWGNYEGPHDEDVPLDEIWPALLRIRAGALLLSMANPRHAHEHRVFEEQGFPSHATLVAGVIDTTTNYIEHPDTVAERLIVAARAIGDPSRVMAGTDCGFETSVGYGPVVEDVAWKKLEALVEGAKRASAKLF